MELKKKKTEPIKTESGVVVTRGSAGREAWGRGSGGRNVEILVKGCRLFAIRSTSSGIYCAE